MLIYIAFILFGIVIFVVVVSVVYFLSAHLSPVPFFPTQKIDLPMIVDEIKSIAQEKDIPHNRKAKLSRTGDLNSVQKTVVIDFGAGTGTVIFPLADALHESVTAYIGVEIHPLLAGIMIIRKYFHEKRKRMVTWRKNMFQITYRNFLCMYKSKEKLRIIFYIYVGNQYITPIKDALKTYPKGTMIVSYMYDIPGWEKYLKRTRTGKHALYTYEL